MRIGTVQICSGLQRGRTVPIHEQMEWPELIGWLATLCSTVSFAPQAWKVIRTRRTQDLSVWMYAVTVTGFGLWTGYGVLLGKWPLIITNVICQSLSSFILAMKLLPRRDVEQVAETLDPET
jgi:MtN3 and saliva related transmembrane protein